MRFLVTGKNGQLGAEFVHWLGENKFDFFAFSRKELDITDLDQVINKIKKFRPNFVINCAAYTDVDKAKSNYPLAYKVNYLGVWNLAYSCKKYNSFLVHYSTDYVFDG